MLNIKPIKQFESYCGPASLEMVLKYYGTDIDQKKLGEMCRTDQATGTSIENLAKAARDLGYKAKIRKFAKVSDIENYVLIKKVPVIVNWFSENDGHYSVVADINNSEIVLVDPEINGIRKIDLQTFLRIWFDYLDEMPGLKSRFVIRNLLAIYK